MKENRRREKIKEKERKVSGSYFQTFARRRAKKERRRNTKKSIKGDLENQFCAGNHDKEGGES